MKLTVDRKKLAAALTTLTRVIDTKSNPVLAYVRIATPAGGGVRIEATDLNLSASAQLDATVLKSGSIAVPARELATFVRAAKTDTITLETTDAVVKRLRVGMASVETMLAADFPKLPELAIETFPIVDAATFAASLGAVAPSMSDDTTRYQLCGALIEMDSEARRLRTVATDGHRLTLRDCAAVYAHKALTASIVPAKAVKVLAAVSKSAASLRVGTDEEYLVAHIDSLTITVKLVDAQFPPYEQVIPKDEDQKRTLRVNRATLAEVLKSACDAMKATKERCNGIGLGVNAGKLRAVVYSSADGAVIFSAEIDAEYSGGAFAIAVDPFYLADAVATMGETFTLALGGELDPLKLTSEDGQTVAAVMPMREGGLADAIPAPVEQPEAPAPEKTRAAKPRRRVEQSAATEPRIKVTRVNDDGTRTPIEPAPEPAEAPLPPLTPDPSPEPANVPAPAVAEPIAALQPAAPAGVGELAECIEVARVIVEAFMPFSAHVEAARQDARSCYRCGKVKPFGYVLDGQLCCRDCRGAHREDYYASRGQVAEPRQPRTRRGAAVQTVAALHIRADHVTVEPAPFGNA